MICKIKAAYLSADDPPLILSPSFGLCDSRGVRWLKHSFTQRKNLTRAKK